MIRTSEGQSRCLHSREEAFLKGAEKRGGGRSRAGQSTGGFQSGSHAFSALKGLPRAQNGGTYVPTRGHQCDLSGHVGKEETLQASREKISKSHSKDPEVNVTLAFFAVCTAI